jgi:glycine dehydrogenase subunit 1
MCKANYAMQMLSNVPGVKAPVFKSAHFKEFTVNFDETGLTVGDINKSLLRQRVHGGKDISKEFSELGQTALYCITEIHSKQEIEWLRDGLKQILSER